MNDDLAIIGCGYWGKNIVRVISELKKEKLFHGEVFLYDKDLSKVKVSKYLNEMVWFRGIKKPPMKIKVKVIKEGDVVRAEPSELPNKLKFKKLGEEKREQRSHAGSPAAPAGGCWTGR